MSAILFAAKLPDGWTYTPTDFGTLNGKRCATCGHIATPVEGRLRSPSGREWPLVGNRSAAAERQMVLAIIEANS